MKKKFSIIIILLICMFSGYNVVEASTEMACKYSFDKYDVYLYQDSSGKHEVFKIGKSSSGYIVYNAVLKNSIKEFSECPKYADQDSGYKYQFVDSVGVFTYSDVKLSQTIDNGNYSAWNCSYSFSSNSDKYNAVIEQNKFGLLGYSFTKNNKAVDTSFKLYEFSFGSNSCPTYLASKGYLSGGGDVSFYNNVPSNSSVDNMTKCTGTGCGGSNSSGNSSGTQNKNILVEGSVCAYRHVSGTSCYNGSCDITFNMNEATKKFVTSKYMVYIGDTVYLPKDSSLSSSVWRRYIDGSLDTSNFINDYFESYGASEISVFSNHSNERSDDGCYLWFNNLDGSSGHDYTDSEYWFQYKDSNPEDNPDTENKGNVETSEVISGGEGPYYCVYNGEYGSVDKKTGTIVLKYNSERNRLTLLSDDFNNVFGSYKCEFDDCTNPGNVSFSGYGGAESNMNKEFQSGFVVGNCPAQINYNYNNHILTICKNKSNDCLNGDAGILGNFSGTSYTEGSGNGGIDVSSCNDLISDEMRETLNTYFTIFKIIIPIALIVLGTVDFVKATFASKEEDMKKAQSAFMKRVVIAVVIFFIPTFINLLLDIADNVWGWNSSDCVTEMLDE